MIKKIFLLIFILILGLFIYTAFQPSEYEIVREIKISAPAESIFPYVENLKKFNEWSPWSKIDPQAKLTFEGPEKGMNAIYKWDGNNEVGSGSITITKSDQNSVIQMKLEMYKPFSDSSDVEFNFKPQNMDTIVSWKIKGHAKFISKLLCIFINRDKLIGKEFEKGLLNLKNISEKK